MDKQKVYLSEIKEERNKLIAEKHLLNNELEYIKVIHIIMFSQKLL